MKQLSHNYAFSNNFFNVTQTLCDLGRSPSPNFRQIFFSYPGQNNMVDAPLYGYYWIRHCNDWPNDKQSEVFITMLSWCFKSYQRKHYACVSTLEYIYYKCEINTPNDAMKTIIWILNTVQLKKSNTSLHVRSMLTLKSRS